MRSCVWWVALLALAAAALVDARRNDPDFEFDDDADGVSVVGAHSRRPRRYIYDPHNSLCRSLVCKKREVCMLRDAFTALCANKKDILRKGDLVVAASGGGSEARDEADDDDVFYDAAAHDSEPQPDADLDSDDSKRCVGCGSARASFVCGSDNRTYSSLCRLDLHNCVRRPARPVRLACRGFCPCRRAEARRRVPDVAHDEAPSVRPSRRRVAVKGAGSEGCSLDKMANRLLDWFSVLMDEAGAEPPPPDGFPADCKPEVRWMFVHLDTDGDGALSPANLYALRHDARERCLRPFLSACGGRAVSRGAWCGCLRRAARPCTALARAHAAPGAWRPACDARGYYRPRQCHAALAVCWCVDAHGRELPDSRTKGAPDCPGEGPTDDEDGGGSGEGELRY